MNAVAPGPVETELMKTRYDSQKILEHYIPQIPIGRLSTPEDMAKMVLFLSSDMSDILCGHTILADGGRTRLGIK